MSDYRNPNDPLQRDLPYDLNARTGNVASGWIAGGVFLAHCHRTGVRHRPYAEPGQPQHDGRTTAVAGDAADAERSGEPNLFADAHESDAESGAELLPPARRSLNERSATQNKTAPFSSGAVFMSHHSVASRAMSSGARVIVTPAAFAHAHDIHGAGIFGRAGIIRRHRAVADARGLIPVAQRDVIGAGGRDLSIANEPRRPRPFAAIGRGLVVAMRHGDLPTGPPRAALDGQSRTESCRHSRDGRGPRLRATAAETRSSRRG